MDCFLNKEIYLASRQTINGGVICEICFDTFECMNKEFNIIDLKKKLSGCKVTHYSFYTLFS